MIRFEFIDIIKAIYTWAHGFRKHFDAQNEKLVERLRRIENAMATKAQVEELNANLTEAFSEVSNRIDTLIQELETANQNEAVDLTSALALSRQLKDIVTSAAPEPEETPDAGEGEDTLGGETQADHLDGQEQ